MRGGGSNGFLCGDVVSPQPSHYCPQDREHNPDPLPPVQPNAHDLALGLRTCSLRKLRNDFQFCQLISRRNSALARSCAWYFRYLRYDPAATKKIRRPKNPKYSSASHAPPPTRHTAKSSSPPCPRPHLSASHRSHTATTVAKRTIYAPRAESSDYNLKRKPETQLGKAKPPMNRGKCEHCDSRLRSLCRATKGLPEL